MSEWILDKGNHQEQLIIIQHTRAHQRQALQHEMLFTKISKWANTNENKRLGNWMVAGGNGEVVVQLASPAQTCQCCYFQHHHFSSLSLLNLQGPPCSDLPNLCYPNFSSFELLDKGPTCAVASHCAPKGEYNEAYKANCTCYPRQLLNSARRGWNAPFHLAEQRPANLQGFKSES